MKLDHGMSKEQALVKFPGLFLSAHRVNEQRKATVQERYGVDNVSRADEVRVKLVENNRSSDPEVVAKRNATNEARYGHSNPFGGVEGSQRARAGMQRLYGAPSPQQVPEIRRRTLNTCKERHGSEYAFTAPGFQEQFKATSREHWGTDHPMQSDEGRRVWEDGCLIALGVVNPLSRPDIFQKSYQANLANHGGHHSQQDPVVLSKARETWMEKYGEDNPSKVEAVKARIKDVWMGKYGVPFPPQSRLGTGPRASPNKLEQDVDASTPKRVLFTGDGKVWIGCPGTTKIRNPDFVVLTPDQYKAVMETKIPLAELKIGAVVEIFGDFWHSPRFTKQSRDKHQNAVEVFYGRAGIACLVLWECDIRRTNSRYDARVRSFLTRWGRGTFQVPSDTSPILDLFGQ
jgi:hypothetical protein